MRAIHRPVLILAALLAGLAAPAQAQRRTEIPPLHVRPLPTAPSTVVPDSSGLRYRLSAAPLRAPERETPAPALMLPRADAERILARLEPLPSVAAAERFAFPASTLPPPRAGRTVLAGFPPPDSAGPERPSTGTGRAPLTVVRAAPEGQVDRAAEVTVTFSQPMVPLSTVSTVESGEVPVRISPRIAGSWRWLDVRTVVFTPEGRVPFATEYTVAIPAGTRSATGGVLAEEVRWTFRTPQLTGIGAWPWGDHVRRDPVFLIHFDQQVSPAALLPFIRLTAGGAERTVRLASAEEIQRDSVARAFAAQAEPGTWIAFRATQPLPLNAAIEVQVRAGAPSAEGPLRTQAVQGWRFRTYAPLRLVRFACGYGEDDCRPGTPWVLAFNNSLDTAGRPAEWVRVVPALPGMRVTAAGNQLWITGTAAPNTRYTIHVSRSVRDQFGQVLGRDETRTVRVGPPEPGFIGFAEPMMVLEASGPRTVSVFTHDQARVRLRMHRVRPEDWAGFQPRYHDTSRLPGTPVVDRWLRADPAPGATTEHVIDADEVLRGEPGHVVVSVEPAGESPSVAWLQVTGVGVAAFADRDSVLVWATSLRDGSSIAGAEVRMLPTGSGGVTRADGLATLPLPGVEGRGERERFLVVGRPGDQAILSGQGRGGWLHLVRQETPRQLLWYGITDRNLYRPGEEVRFKGWVRRFTRGETGGLSFVSQGPGVTWRAMDPQGAELARGTARLTEFGGFDGAFTIPAGANLGGASIMVEAEPGSGHPIGYQVQEFRRPEFEVAVEADPGPHVIGGSAEVSVRASYFAGGGLPGAQVDWRVQSQPGFYTPPGWAEWRFGMETGGWWSWRSPAPAQDHRALSGETDARGRHGIRLDLDRAVPPRPYALNATATVIDVNRQPWTANATLLVHPAEVYAGLRTARNWQSRGEPIRVEGIVVDLDGKPVVGRPVRVRAERMAWVQRGGDWDEVARDTAVCEFVSDLNPRTCTFATPEGGRYRLVADVADERGRPSRTEVTVWVSGGDPVPPQPGQRLATGREARLLPDREAYAPGDTARILVQLPFWPARGVMTVRRAGIVRTETVASDSSTLLLSVPLTEADIPNTHVQVDLVGASDTIPGSRGTDFATGSALLRVPPTGRSLTLTPLPADSVLVPDAPASVSVQVTDARGRPVPGAEVALAVVDEAVLALTGYRFQDPLELFHPSWDEGATDAWLHPSVLKRTTGAGVVAGRVLDPQGQPVAGAMVTVAGTQVRTATDAAGAFRLVGVPAGPRIITVARVGMGTASREVVVGAEPVQVEIVMQPQAVMLEGLAVADYAGAVQGRVAGAEVRVRGMSSREGPPPPAAIEMAAPPPPPQAPQPAIAIRTNFNPLAVWTPVVRTGPDGRATVPFTLPSSLTRYRVMAVAAQGLARFGAGESSITVRQPLMVRPSAPRFLNFGDRFEFAVVIQNQTGQPMTVDVAARAEGIAFAEPGRRVTVPANDRVEVRIPGEAVRAGTAYVQVAAVSGSRSDAAFVTLPVYTPATAEAFATYGNFTEGAATLPLQIDENDVLPGFGGLEVSTSSTALHELTDAFLYLVKYPYQGSEQIASRLLAVAALRDVLTEFRAEGLPPAQELADSVARDIQALRRMQNHDGGWNFWRTDRESWPYVSVHVTHALVRMRERGYDVPENMMQRALQYTRTVRERMPRWYGPSERRAVRAYALYVRSLAGERVGGEVTALLREVGSNQLPVEVAGWLLAASAGQGGTQEVRAELLRIVNNRATETASTATFATEYEQGEYLILHSRRRTDAVVLEALLRTDPRNPLVAKTVRGLLGGRRAGRWSNTQENAWVLLALDRYFREYEAQTPDFVARLWLGERFAGEHAFAGRNADRHQLTVPIDALVELDPESVTVGKEGAGRVYYRAGLRYAPRGLDLPALDRGFSVERTYEAIDDPSDVVRGENGVWRIRPGARVRVTVTMVAPSRRVHVALVDPLPAGFEAVNTALRGAEVVPPPDTPDQAPWAVSHRGWWWGPWFQHQNLRDDRAEAFTTHLNAGVHTYSYVARATTPGEFIVPPPRAEEMYSPETFGRGSSDRVRIQDN
jgi:uncharacterized protein YfaS (alpha-2-macroglobulin family)